MSAAIRVFSKYGFRHALIDEIAREANVSPATLYKYFESKSHLFHYAMEHGTLQGELPPPEISSVRSENDLIEVLREYVSKRIQLASVETCLKATAEDINVMHELSGILEELWELIETHRAQLSMSQVNSPLDEFPELIEVFTDGLQSILDQIGDYLSARIRMGKIRPFISVRVTARIIMETVFFFAWKQELWNIRPLYRKEEAFSTLVEMLGHGLALPE